MSCDSWKILVDPRKTLEGAVRVDNIDHMGYPIYHVPHSGEIFYEAEYRRPVQLPSDVEAQVRAMLAQSICQG